MYLNDINHKRLHELITWWKLTFDVFARCHDGEVEDVGSLSDWHTMINFYFALSRMLLLIRAAHVNWISAFNYVRLQHFELAPSIVTKLIGLHRNRVNTVHM